MKNKILISGVLFALSGCSGPMISYDAYQKQPLVFLSNDAINDETVQEECGIKKCVISDNTINCNISDRAKKSMKLTNESYRFLGKSEKEYYFSHQYPKAERMRSTSSPCCLILFVASLRSILFILSLSTGARYP